MHVYELYSIIFQSLEGLSLWQLEEGSFFSIAPDIQTFENLRALDIQDCNIYLQEGITRSRTYTRTQLYKTLKSLKHLRRLDLSFNYLIGCLGEILTALHSPLEFLSLRGCDLNEHDLVSLGESKHASSLRELNVSKLCQFSIYESARISPSSTLRVIKNFPNLSILNLSQNNLPDSRIQEFGEMIVKNLICLKGLDISGNIMQFESQMALAKCCAQIPTMQWIRLTCMNAALNNGIFIDNNHLFEMVTKLRNAMKSCGREDICVDVVRLSFAILVDLIDL